MNQQLPLSQPPTAAITAQLAVAVCCHQALMELPSQNNGHLTIWLMGYNRAKAHCEAITLPSSSPSFFFFYCALLAEDRFADMEEPVVQP